MQSEVSVCKVKDGSHHQAWLRQQVWVQGQTSTSSAASPPLQLGAAYITFWYGCPGSPYMEVPSCQLLAGAGMCPPGMSRPSPAILWARCWPMQLLVRRVPIRPQ